nr:carbohydrate ABC transporter permease [uncultured Niameybacter sp.]
MKKQQASALKKLNVESVLTYTILGIFAMLVIVPLCWVLMQSFKTKTEFFGPSSWTLPQYFYLDNYGKAWVDAGMSKYFFNTVFVTVLSLVIVVVMSVPCSYALSRYRFKGSKIIFTLIMGGIFINVNYIVIPIYTMVTDFGKMMGIKGLVNNLGVLSLIYAITSVPFAVYLLSAYFKSLPVEYEEAAKIDGCNYFGILTKIIIPLSKPSIITVILFNFMKFWNEYIIGITFISNPEKWTISIGLLNIMEVERVANDYGRMYAGLVIAMLPTIILYCIVQGKLTKGISIGGIKG